MPVELSQLIEGLALRRPRPSVAAIHRQVSKIAKERDAAAPSYATVHSIVHGLDSALTTLAQEGQAAFSNRYELIQMRASRRPP